MTKPKRAKAPTTEDYRPIADAFNALRDPSRVHILALLSDGSERTVSTIVDTLNASNGGRGITQPTVSHHLRVLHAVGLVRSEKRGSFVWVGSSSEHISWLAHRVLDLTGDRATVAA